MNKNLLSIVVCLSGFSSTFLYANVCSRSLEVVSAIEKAAQKSCAEVTKDDLETILDLEIKDLKAFIPLDFEDLPQLQSLVLTDAKFDNLAGDAFSSMTQLTYLKIAGLGSLRLDVETFRSLLNLEILQIESELEAIEPFTFIGLDKLKIVDLNFKPGVVLSSFMFNGLKTMEFVRLSGSGLVISPELFDGMSIQWLLIRSNGGTIKNNAFSQIPNLESLQLSSGGLQDPQVSMEFEPRALSGLSQITKLSLSGFDHLPSEMEIAELTKLTVLEFMNTPSVWSNRDRFFRLPQLKMINMIDRNLVELPSDAFNSLTGLTRLSLSLRNLTSLEPSIFKQLTNLKSFALLRHNLGSLDPSFFGPDNFSTDLSVTLCKCGLSDQNILRLREVLGSRLNIVGK